MIRTREKSLVFIYMIRHDIEELVADQIYDKLTILFNNTRKKVGIRKGRLINPIREYDNFKPPDDGALAYKYKKTVIDLGNINERIKLPSTIRKLSVNKLKLMGFTDITDEDVYPQRTRYVKVRKKLRKFKKQYHLHLQRTQRLLN